LNLDLASNHRSQKVKLQKVLNYVSAKVEFNGRTVQRCGHSYEEAFEKARKAWNETCDYLFSGDFKIPEYVVFEAPKRHPWINIFYDGRNMKKVLEFLLCLFLLFFIISLVELLTNCWDLEGDLVVRQYCTELDFKYN